MNRQRTYNEPARATSPGQWLALLVGVAYLGAGLAGFAVTGFDRWFDDSTGETLLGFEINPLHNVVHLLIGLAGVAMWSTARNALAFGLVLAVGYAAAFAYGLVALGEEWDVLSINDADNVLHLGSALAGVAIAWLAARTVRTRAPAGIA